MKNILLRYDCDEWFVENMKVTTNSLGFFYGFGIFLDFERCSIKAAKRKNAK
jgi:hypothetical protein